LSSLKLCHQVNSYFLLLWNCQLSLRAVIVFNLSCAFHSDIQCILSKDFKCQNVVFL
jgi:hypothetical protein